MRILVNGMGGYMGRQVEKLALAGVRGTSLAGGVDPFAEEIGNCVHTLAQASEADCIVDFSHHDCTMELLNYAVEKKLPLVLATTGHTPEEKEAIRAASEKIPLFFAANYSMGIALLAEMAKKVVAAMPEAEIEIIEKHHDRKLDAPSGTALALAEAIREVRSEAEVVCGRSGQGKRTKTEIGIHAIRMGNIVGEHEILVGTPNQMITLKHEAFDRALFAEGALAAAVFLKDKGPGMYNMKDLVQF